MVHFDYLPKGLYAMARAHRVSTMSGHLGAAVVAGHFIGEQHPDLDERVCKGIEAELERIIRGESVFSPKKDAALSAPAMFEPFAREPPRENLIDSIADALSRNIHRTRESGHNVIFAAIAIRALNDHPELATPSIIDGIRKLISGFDNASPGSGYFGREKGRIDGRQITLPHDDAIPPLPDLETMANTAINDLIQHAAQRREGFGGPWHVINHAAALAELTRRGYRELAIKGLPAFHEHFRLFKAVPDVSDEKGAETPTADAPLTPSFWSPEKIRRERAHLTHRIKTIYGFGVLVELVTNERQRNEASDKLRYLM
ncbi:MAG: hypothetical protein A3K19_01945 [Lentisphaerae bacterium RIFOXYB12_FULL_65_16]|nr:MAG: hypothetical protein A3K18_29450 [Lentisphaerae bacterium RIFOXYA12_64_32]OGV92640.1 MAG: hypothetical protein A3K19_01945 [Lentisphaerae bacterium RIFOXYB12_FULL_65_16]